MVVCIIALIVSRYTITKKHKKKCSLAYKALWLAEVYLEACQRSNMELFAEIVNSFQPFAFFTKS